MLMKFDRRIFPTEAILHTCQVFSEAMSCRVDRKGTETWVTLNPRNNHHPDDLAGRFQNELTHQVLRLMIAKENKEIRESLVRQALTAALPRPARRIPPQPPGRASEPAQRSTGQPPAPPVPEDEIDKELEEILKEVETETGNFKDDPLGIAVPWEEKHGKDTAPKPNRSKDNRD